MKLTLKPTALAEVFDKLTQSIIVPKSRYKLCLIIILYIFGPESVTSHCILLLNSGYLMLPLFLIYLVFDLSIGFPTELKPIFRFYNPRLV